MLRCMASDDPASDHQSQGHSRSEEIVSNTSNTSNTSKKAGLGDWFESVWMAIERVPKLDARLMAWLPVLLAAKRTRDALLELGQEALSADEWRVPDAQLAELVGALSDLAGAFPGIDEALPTFDEMGKLRSEVAADPSTRALGKSALGTIEALAQSALAKVVDLAFFSKETPQSEATAERLSTLLKRVELAADRLLASGIEAMASPPTDGSTGDSSCEPQDARAESPFDDVSSDDVSSDDVSSDDVSSDDVSSDDVP